MNYKIIFKYTLYIILLLILICFYCHYISLKKINNHNHNQILQTYKPSFNKIQNILVNKSLTVFKDVLYEWEPIVNIFDKSLDFINNEIQNNKQFHDDLIDCFNSYSLFGSIGWEYFFFKKNNNDTQNYFTLQTQHRHLICQILGVQRIYLASPNQSHLIKNKTVDISKKNNNYNKKNTTKSIIDFWNENETSSEPFNKLEFIEIILREGNVLYIPYGWWFLSEIEEESLICESFNLSIISLFC
jgi:hypothetical protein